MEFDVVEGTVIQSIERALDLGEGLALVESIWVCDVAAEGYDGPHLRYNLELAMKVRLSSVVSVDNSRLAVRSHEVTDVEVVEVNGPCLDE